MQPWTAGPNFQLLSAEQKARLATGLSYSALTRHLGLRWKHRVPDHLISHAVLWGMSMAVYPPGPASAGIEMQANGSLPVISLYLPVPPVMMWVPQFISGCDLSTSRVSNVEKIWSPSASVNTQAPSMYFMSPDATLSAAQRADILSSIFSPFMFWVVPTASRLVAVPRPGISMLINGRKMKCVTQGVCPSFLLVVPLQPAEQKPREPRRRALF